MGTATICCPVVLCFRAMNRVLLSRGLLCNTCCTGLSELCALHAQLAPVTDHVSGETIVQPVAERTGRHWTLNDILSPAGPAGPSAGNLRPESAPSTSAPCKAAVTAGASPLSTISAVLGTSKKIID
jgi:hypothetical protein